MATGRPHLMAKENRWERYLDMLRLGHGHTEALITLGVSQGSFNRFVIAHPELRDEAIAMKEAATEPVLRNLRDLALTNDPEVDIGQRISASKAYLDYIRKDRSETAVHIKHEHMHTVDPATLKSISDLSALVEQRRAIDVESVEITDELHQD